jgi:hypothetical protein
MFPNHFTISPRRIQHSNGMKHMGIPSTAPCKDLLSRAKVLAYFGPHKQSHTSWFVSNPLAKELREG